MLNIFNWKYRFFGKKIKQVRNALADLEFKLFKVREMREERRKQRDMAVQTLDQITARLATQEDETLKAQKDEQEKYLKHVTDQIDALDIEINGAKATDTTNEYNGVVQQIEAAVQLLEMYKEYRKNL